eukprot:2198548-Alexandrium_andersonii.AAC.1
MIPFPARARWKGPLTPAPRPDCHPRGGDCGSLPGTLRRLHPLAGENAAPPAGVAEGLVSEVPQETPYCQRSLCFLQGLLDCLLMLP